MDGTFPYLRVADQEFLIWSIQDISEEIRAKEEAILNMEKANHAEKMASIGEMSAAIVHEIRNPLTVIIGRFH